MAKATKKRKSASKAESNQRTRRSISKKKPRVDTRAHAGTKQALAIAMLRLANGASITALMEATGWQQHSVRGFLAGVVRKRLGLPLESMKVDGSRVYRIADDDDVERQPTTDQPTS